MDAIRDWVGEHDPGAEAVPDRPARVHRLALVAPRLPGLRRLRLLPAAPPDALRRVAADPRRRRAHRRPRPRLRGRVLRPPAEADAHDDRTDEAATRRHGAGQRPARARPDALGRRRAHPRRRRSRSRPAASRACARADDVPGVRGVVRLGRGDGRHPARQARPARGAAAVPARLRASRSPRGATVGGDAAAQARRAAGEVGAALLSVAPALFTLRAGEVAQYHGVEHKAIAAYEQDDDDAARRRQGARALRLAPRRADDGLQPRRDAAAQAGPRPPEPAGRRRRRARLHRGRRRGLRLGRAPRAAPRSRAPSARPGFAIQRAIGTREPDERQLEVGRAALAEILRRRGRGVATPIAPKRALIAA